ncbi:DNA sulfur modification protein DndD [Kitasatospora sp. NPDC059795]|uniref:DNA sulfur modification protein DndD n=1 Tax=Kitasatospora sp. NPDC059795 TaxID=3346949 RepID=UPI00365BFA7A
MLLRKITLEEFGAYRGKQSLNLTPKKGKPVILIGGLNGCGKTTLLDAIQLVLYGNRARCSGRGTGTYETYLRESINRMADPARGSAVTLEFTTMTGGQEHYYRVVRSWHISGKTLKEFLNVYVDEAYGERTRAVRTAQPEPQFNRLLSESWADHIESLLPLEIASLAFFDGEKIESLADPDRAASVIESAVHSLLGVSTVQQLRNDLLALQRRQKLSDEEQHLLDKIHAQEREHDEVLAAYDVAHQELGKSRNDLRKAQRTLESLEAAFEKEGGGLFNRRVELENERKSITDQLAQVRSDLVQLAAGPLPLLMATGLIADLREQAVLEKQARRSAQVLEVLQERDSWLLDMLPAATRAEVVAKLEADRADRAESTELDVDLQLPHDALEQFGVLEELLQRDSDRGRLLLTAAADLSDELDQLDRQLAGVPEQHKVEALQQAREEQLVVVAHCRAAGERADARLGELKRRREHVRTLLERAHTEFVRTKVKAEEVERILKYSEKARATLERFGSALLQRHIGKLEWAVLDSFKALMRKQGLVKSLRIDTEKFALTLGDSTGNPIDPARLSAGERQLLAVSLLWGLMRVAGNRLPSVIDTPLGRLDSRHREHLVTRYFPQASEQVLLLSTDEEIDEYLLGRLRKSVARTYTLVHDDEELTTQVVEGYWWNEGVQHVG